MMIRKREKLKIILVLKDKFSSFVFQLKIALNLKVLDFGFILIGRAGSFKYLTRPCNPSGHQ